MARCAAQQTENEHTTGGSGAWSRTIIKRDGRTAEFQQEKIAEPPSRRRSPACAAMQDRAVAEEIAAKGRREARRGAPIEGIAHGRGRSGPRRGDPHRIRLRPDGQVLHPLSRRAQPRARDEHPPDAASTRTSPTRPPSIPTSSAKTPTSTAIPPWARCSSTAPRAPSSST